MSSYIFWIVPSYQILFANIFSQFISCLFVLLIVCFSEDFNFDLVPLVDFVFVSCAFGVMSKNSLLRSVSRSLPSVFSSRSFMV